MLVWDSEGFGGFELEFTECGLSFDFQWCGRGLEIGRLHIHGKPVLQIHHNHPLIDHMHNLLCPHPYPPERISLILNPLPGKEHLLTEQWHPHLGLNHPLELTHHCVRTHQQLHSLFVGLPHVERDGLVWDGSLRLFGDHGVFEVGDWVAADGLVVSVYQGDLVVADDVLSRDEGF